jgi:hypothetical protein
MVLAVVAHREFLAVCGLAATVDPMRRRAACAATLARGDISADGVRTALRGAAPDRADIAVLPLSLAGVDVPAGDVGQYGGLLAADP